MQKKQFPNLVVALALAAMAADAMAMGFGAASSSATLGQGLDHSIALRLDPGETLTAECVNADVLVGEQRLSSAAVRTRLDPGDGQTLLLRVQTTSVIDEPLVSVSVSVGCPTRLSRRFTLFADPAPVNAPSVPLPALAPAAADALPTAPAAPLAAPPEPRAQLQARPRQATRVASGGAPTPRPPRAPRPAPRRADPVPATTAAAVAPARPRLKLEAAEPAPPAITAEVIEAAASAAAAQAAAQAASAAAERISGLEKAIEKLRADSQADREALRLLRQKAAETDAVSAWMPWLAALSAALAGLALWLALKLRRLQRERQQSWWNPAAAPDAAATPSTAGRGETGSPTTSAEATLGSPPSSGGYSTTRPGTLGPVFATDLPSVSQLDDAPLISSEATQPLPVGWRDDEPARDVTIEELIDLEQQAEFFIVLGQEEAAVDLLVDHLRSTGGGSPMPYLKLLEIYRRRGDREAYDRTRARFNHRFNAYAPDWDDDATGGRSLEDYPAIVARLQMAWPSPIDAMAELESLLFRKTRGELFDMPAYRDVLFLFSLARDLLDREPIESGNVDVLLPINDGADFTQPMSLDEMPPAFDSALVSLDNAPTVPVDLDITQPAVPESLFGETATEPGVPGSSGGRRRR